VEQFGSSPGS